MRGGIARAGSIEEQAGQQALLRAARPLPLSLAIAVEQRLRPVPRLLVEDGGVLAWIGRCPVPDKTEIVRVAQHGIERSAGEGVAAAADHVVLAHPVA